MKAIKIFLPITIFLILISCEDFLDEVPEDRLTDASFYKNEQDAISSVNAIYDAVKQTYDVNYISEINLKSDYMDGRGSRVPSGSFMSNAVTVNRQGDIWTDFYRVISRANISIKNIPLIVDDQNLRNRLLGECYFLRAFSHLQIGRLFGPAPIRIEAIDDFAKIPAPRAPITELYAQIINDLQSAEQLLPEVTSYGRANKGAVQMALAMAHLWQGNFELAMQNADKVINSGTYKLEQSYGDVFHPEELSEENVFLIRHARESGFPTNVLAWYHAADWPEFSGSFFVFLGNRNTFIVDWDDSDQRKSWNIYDKNTPLTDKNGKTVFIDGDFIHFGKFRDPNAISAFELSYHYPIYRLAEAYLIYAEADIRDDGNLGAQGREYWNMIRRRGYGRDVNISASDIDVPTTLTSDELLDEMLLERGKEFMGESKRWFDMLRFNKAEELITQAGYTFEPRVVLFPLPIAEINANEALTSEDQNPGY